MRFRQNMLQFLLLCVLKRARKKCVYNLLCNFKWSLAVLKARCRQFLIAAQNPISWRRRSSRKLEKFPKVSTLKVTGTQDKIILSFFEFVSNLFQTCQKSVKRQLLKSTAGESGHFEEILLKKSLGWSSKLVNSFKRQRRSFTTKMTKLFSICCYQ